MDSVEKLTTQNKNLNKNIFFIDKIYKHPMILNAPFPPPSLSYGGGSVIWAKVYWHAKQSNKADI